MRGRDGAGVAAQRLRCERLPDPRGARQEGPAVRDQAERCVRELRASWLMLARSGVAAAGLQRGAQRVWGVGRFWEGVATAGTVTVPRRTLQLPFQTKRRIFFLCVSTDTSNVCVV